MEKQLEEVKTSVQVVWGRVSVCHYGRVNDVSQVNGELRYGNLLSMQAGGGDGDWGTQQRNKGVFQPFHPESFLPALP